MMVLTMARPKPVALSLVEKNGVNIRSMFSAGMPIPVSPTAIRMYSPAGQVSDFPIGQDDVFGPDLDSIALPWWPAGH